MQVAELTKGNIAKLNSAPIEVSLWNGCFNRAVVTAEYSRYTIEVRVDVTHPELVWQCGNHDTVELIDWRIGRSYKVPEELYGLVERMKKAATMQDEEALALSAENKALFTEGMRELGIYD